MKIENIGKAEAVMLGDEIMEAVDKIAAKYGLSAKRGGGRYGNGEYKLNNIVLFPKNASAVAGMVPSKANRLELDWKLKSAGWGMDNVNVGDEFYNPKGEKIKLIGWDSKKRKYPVIYENLDKGGQYKTTMINFKGYVYNV